MSEQPHWLSVRGLNISLSTFYLRTTMMMHDAAMLFMSQARVTVKGLRRHMTVKMLRDSGSHNQKDLAAIASSAMDGKESGGSTKVQIL